MFTHFFIDRPILSSVISILIVLGGLVAMSVAPIEQYPELAPPQVQVTARYPGSLKREAIFALISPTSFTLI